MGVTKESVKTYRDYLLKFKGVHFSLSYDVIDEIKSNKNIVLHFSFIFGRRFILTLFENHFEDFSYSHSLEDIKAETNEEYFMKYFGSEMKLDGRDYPHMYVAIPQTNLLERFLNLREFLLACKESEIKARETIDLIENVSENVKTLLFRYVYNDNLTLDQQIRLICEFAQTSSVDLISKYAFDCVNNEPYKIDFSNRKKKIPEEYINEKKQKIFNNKIED
jgi:hypothetical protein